MPVVINKDRTWCWKALLLLAVLTFGIYLISLGNGFVLDDEVIIVNNPDTLSLRSLPEVLFAPDVVKPYYRPLNRGIYLLEYQFFGMNPTGFHAVSVLVHLANTLVLFLLSCRLLGDRAAALVVALLFAVHPVNTEAVNFVSARNTLLSAFFSLASLLALVRAKDAGVKWPLLAPFLFFCGLLSKETAFMLLPLVALYTLVPLPQVAVERGEGGASDSRIHFRVLLPFLLLTVVYFALRSYSLGGVIASQSAEQGLLSRLAQNYQIIPQYLGLLFFPVDLTVFHTPQVNGGLLALPLGNSVVWALLVAGLVGAVISRNRVILLGLAWCVLNYAPIANIVPIPSSAITERFLYLPALGLFLAAGVPLSWLLARPGWKVPVWCVITLVVTLLSARTVQRNADWRSDLTLFASGVANDPNSADARYNLGTAYRDIGNLDAAVREWRQVLQIDPQHSDTLIQFGTYHAFLGDLPQAKRYYLAALAAPRGVADPGKAMAYYNLGIISEKEGTPRLALQYYDTFLKLVQVDYREYEADARQRVARLRVAPGAAAE